MNRISYSETLDSGPWTLDFHRSASLNVLFDLPGYTSEKLLRAGMDGGGERGMA